MSCRNRTAMNQTDLKKRVLKPTKQDLQKWTDLSPIHRVPPQLVGDWWIGGKLSRAVIFCFFCTCPPSNELGARQLVGGSRQKKEEMRKRRISNFNPKFRPLLGYTQREFTLVKDSA